MKKIILGSVLMMASVAFADITIVPSKLDGNATELPAGVLQILNPSINIDGRLCSLSANEQTARITCGMIGKSYLALQEGSVMSQARISFGINGELKFVSNSLEDGNDISVLTCK